MVLLSLISEKGRQQHIDQLDADKGDDDAAQAVNQQIAAKQA
jgi:hypothetical protein